MSACRSESTGEPYGVRRICRTLDVPRSSFYEQKRRKRSRGRKANKRGPVPAVSDDELLALIREDLASTPFVGEGHRKVWARLKFGKGIRVSRKRVLCAFSSIWTPDFIERGHLERSDAGTPYEISNCPA